MKNERHFFYLLVLFLFLSIYTMENSLEFQKSNSFNYKPESIMITCINQSPYTLCIQSALAAGSLNRTSSDLTHNNSLHRNNCVLIPHDRQTIEIPARTYIFITESTPQKKVPHSKSIFVSQKNRLLRFILDKNHGWTVIKEESSTQQQKKGKV